MQDYQAFASATGREWPPPSFGQDPTHPAVNVSWEDAQTFCAWLTEKERKEGRLGPNTRDRLPTDAEWSIAVGIGPEPGTSPKEKDGKITNQYPWDQPWPPPRGAGNYGVSLQVDDFANTSPVGSFAVNQFGLCDLGGNVWQWCEDEYAPGDGARVLRGASWVIDSQLRLLSSARNRLPAADSNNSVGFRAVLAGDPAR